MRPVLMLIVLSLVSQVSALGIGDEAPALTGVTWIKGEAVEPKGAVTVVEFWATWCGPCKQSIPHLSALQAKHPAMRMIGLSDEDEVTVRPFVDQMGDAMAYRVGLVPEDVRAAYMAGVEGIPHAFLIDPAGVVLWQGHPMTMEAVLDQVLAGTFDGAKAKQMALAEGELQAALAGRPDLPKAKAAIVTLLSIDPGHEQAFGLSIAIAKHEQRPGDVRSLLLALPIDRLSASQANGIVWERAIDSDLAYRNLDLCLALIDQALTLEPKEAGLADTKARVLYGLCRLDEAIAEQQRAVSLDPGSDDLKATLDYYRSLAGLAAPIAPAVTP